MENDAVYNVVTNDIILLADSTTMFHGCCFSEAHIQERIALYVATTFDILLNYIAVLFLGKKNTGRFRGLIKGNLLHDIH